MLIAVLQCVSAANGWRAPSHDKQYILLNTMPNLLMTTELSIDAKMPGYSTKGGRQSHKEERNTKPKVFCPVKPSLCSLDDTREE